MQGATNTQQMTAAQQNAIGRAALLSSGIKMSQLVWQGQALTAGQPNRFNLLRTGISTGCLVEFTLELDITAAMTANSSGPWSYIQNIQYTDFSGVTRVNTDGFSLWLLNTLKAGELGNNAVAGVIGNIGNIDTDILTLPTATGSTQHVYFSLYIPFAYNPSNDLRGAIPSLTNIGEHYITITPANSLTSSTDALAAPYSAGTATIVSSTVNITQFYIQPQSLAASALPGVDLTTIYELNGNNTTTSGFLSNSQVLINWPNDRSVQSAIHIYENGGALTLNGSDLILNELIVNSNTTFRQLTPRTQRSFMRSLTKGDVPSGVYYWPSRQQPILTQLYATVQARYTLGTVNTGVTKIVALYESFYPSGQPLSGITPNAG